MSPTSSARRSSRARRPLMVVLGVVGLLVLAMVACHFRPKPPQAPYRTVAVERGAITKAVSASGTMQALVTVDVGSQISGQIINVLVDFNDQVKKGQVMATLDPLTYRSRVAQGQADVNAGLAAVNQAEAQAANARSDFERKKALVAQGVYSPSVLDQATSADRNAQALVVSARARVAQSRAALDAARVDLGRTTIAAPIDGLVIDRKINPGQTVAASLQAPVLFTLAEDLSKIQVKISVDEADIGQVREGQKVRFTVDAYPDDGFEGVVTQVRKQPTTEQNVVSYTVIAEAQNPQAKLLPGMTANADIVIETHQNVLKVPVAALRWSPPAARPGAGGIAIGGPGFGPPGFGAPAQGNRGLAGRTVYVLRDGKPAPVRVRTGASDGTSTEVAGPLKPGDAVIVGGGPKGLKGAAAFGGPPPGGGASGGGGQVRVRM